MCLNCKVPEAEEFASLDSFDLAFMTMVGRVEWIDQKDAAFLLMTKSASHASGVYLWGPEADLLNRVLQKAYSSKGKKYVKRILASFDLSDDISVNKSKLTKALTDSKKMGKEMWLSCGAKVRSTVAATIGRAEKHFTAQQKEELKKKQDVDEFLAMVNTDHCKKFMETYPERILHPEVKRLVQHVETKVDARIIDKAILMERLEKLPKKPELYFSNMSDVQVGRTWTQTGLEMAQQQGVTEYVIIAEHDKKTCPVCQRLHGRRFPVQPAYDRIVQTQDASPEEIAEAHPFPRVHQIDNVSPAAIRAMELAPPFHGRCRCDTHFLWRDAPSSPGAVPPEKQPMLSIGRMSNCIVRTKIEKKVTKPDPCIDFVRKGGEWWFKGKMLTGKDLKRIKAMKIPPAWSDVVVSRRINAKVQAIGVDKAGRWQYRYSAKHTAVQAQKKWNRLKSFREDLEAVREGVKAGIKNDETGSWLLNIMDRTAIRRGSATDFKAKKKAFGLTTLQKEHVKVRGNKVTFDFVAKEGKPGHYEIIDKALAKWIRGRMNATEAGEMLFPEMVGPKLNKYLKKLSKGKGYTAKDFRTYHGTRIAFEELQQYAGQTLTVKQRAAIVKKVSEKVAKFLSNTPIMARNSYIDPMVWEHIGGIRK